MAVDPKMLKDKLAQAAKQRLLIEKKIVCFSHENLESKATEKQDNFFKSINTPQIRYRYLQGGNQASKTSCGIRESVWVLEDTHPYWERPNSNYCHICKSKDFYVEGGDQPGAETWHCNSCNNIWKDWGNLPIGMIIAGQDRTNLETNIWSRVRALLTRPEEWKPIRNGSTLLGQKNTRNNNVILFFPHSYSVEEARAACQGYIVMFVWADEMPPAEVIEELQRRVDTRYGYFLGTFTPKKAGPKIRRVIKEQVRVGIALCFNFKKSDNPHFAHNKEYERKKLAGLSESKKRTIEDGDWPEEEDSVYAFDHATMVVPKLPEYYSHRWPHMEIVDPAMAGKTGYLICALDEDSDIWYSVRAEYIVGIQTPSLLVQEVHGKSRIYNIVERAADSHESWYIKQAHGDYPEDRYKIPFNKTHRKKELIKNLQQALTDGWFKILESHKDLIDELEECKFNDAGEKIIAASKYHILDCAQYFVDCRPKTIVHKVYKSYYKECIEATDRYRKQKEEKKDNKSSIIYSIKRFNKKLSQRRRR